MSADKCSRRLLCPWCQALAQSPCVTALGYTLWPENLAKPAPWRKEVQAVQDTADRDAGLVEFDIAEQSKLLAQTDTAQAAHRSLSALSNGVTEDDRRLFGSNADYPTNTLQNAKDNAATCWLCAKIWKGFEEWATSRFGSITAVDVSKGKVRIMRARPATLLSENGVHSYASAYLQRAVLVAHVPSPEGLPLPGNLFGVEAYLRRAPPLAVAGSDIFHMLSSTKYGPETLEWPDEVDPYSGRPRPRVADLRLFRKWKTLCIARHRTACCIPPTLSSSMATGGASSQLNKLRLIDVEQMCIVELSGPEKMQWVALSYVWGPESASKPAVKLVEADLTAFQLPGSLGCPSESSKAPTPASWLPGTIADAIRVTIGLGERYLWVDSLCIMQDSVVDKAYYLSKMHAIYGLAVLTIVQASGDDAYHGLAGVRTGTRTAEETPFSFSPAGHGQTDDDDQYILSHTWMPWALLNPDVATFAKWFTRGWTFQECLLSRRLLIFTKEQVFWECHEAIWNEDTNAELPRYREKSQAVFYHSPFHSRKMKTMWDGRPVVSPPAPGQSSTPTVLSPPAIKAFDTFQESYTDIVNNYSRRRLTHGSDGLDAISGVLQALTMTHGIEFIWGMPTIFLKSALAWLQVPLMDQKMHRRQELCTRVLQDAALQPQGIVKSHLPSWSWVGWRGEACFYSASVETQHLRAGLEFYYFPLASASTDDLVLCHIPQAEFTREDGGADNDDASAVCDWKGDTKVPITTLDIPVGLREAEDLRYTLLAFWTSRARLILQWEPDANTSREEYALLAEDGTKLDYYWDQPPAFGHGRTDPKESPSRRVRVDVVVVGRLLEMPERRLLSTVLVATGQYGELTRYGCASVKESDWDKLRNRVWDKVYMV